MGKFLFFPVGPGPTHYYALWSGNFNGYTGYEPDATFVKNTSSTDTGIYLTKHSTVDGSAEWIAGIYANSTTGAAGSSTFQSSVNMAADGGVFVCMSMISVSFGGSFTVFRSADGTEHLEQRTAVGDGYISRWTADGQLMWVHHFGTYNLATLAFQGMQATQLSPTLVSLHVGMNITAIQANYTFTDGDSSIVTTGATNTFPGPRNTFQIRLNAATGEPSGLADGRGLFRSVSLNSNQGLGGHIAYFNATALGANYYVPSWASQRDRYEKLINAGTPDALAVTSPFANPNQGSFNHIARYNTSTAVFQGLSRFGLGRTTSLTSDKSTYQAIHTSRIGGYYSVAFNNTFNSPAVSYDLGYRVYNEADQATIYTVPEAVFGRSIFLIRCQENGTPIWSKYFGGAVSQVAFGSIREERDVFEDNDGFAVYWLRYNNFAITGATAGSPLAVHDNFAGAVSRTYQTTNTLSDENVVIEKVNQNTGDLEWGVSISIENHNSIPFFHMVRSRQNFVEVYIRRVTANAGITALVTTPSGPSVVNLLAAPVSGNGTEGPAFYRIILDYATGDIISGTDAQYLGQFIRSSGNAPVVRLSNTFIP